MSTVLGGYEDSDSSKGSALTEVTSSAHGNKNYLDTIQIPKGLAMRQDFASGSFPIYIGQAVAGGAEGDAVWRISKNTYSNNKLISVTWAGGVSTFSQVWDDRAGLVYS